MDLANRKYLYRFISSVQKIHLGLANKMLIDRAMKEHNPTTMDDIGEIIINHLIRFGYERESRKLRESREYQEKWLKDFTEYVFQKYKPKS
jgi:hypothetical protein